MKSWLKGGLITSIGGVILFFVYGLIRNLFTETANLRLIEVEGIGMFFGLFTFYVFIALFIIGAIIGWVIDKIRNRNLK